MEWTCSEGERRMWGLTNRQEEDGGGRGHGSPQFCVGCRVVTLPGLDLREGKAWGRTPGTAARAMGPVATPPQGQPAIRGLHRAALKLAAPATNVSTKTELTQDLRTWRWLETATEWACDKGVDFLSPLPGSFLTLFLLRPHPAQA